MVSEIDPALTCAYGCGWEKQSSVLPIPKIWRLQSSFATVCSECLHSLFLFWRASHANSSGWWSASTYWVLSMCPTGKDNKKKWTIICHSQRWIIRLGLGGPSRFLNSSFYPGWEYSDYTCHPDTEKTAQTMFHIEQTQFGESEDLISCPSNTCLLTTPSLSFLLN